jgi:hypothetical protein
MSTYATGDAGIQGESQREITASRKKLIWLRLGEFQKNPGKLVDKPPA